MSRWVNVVAFVSPLAMVTTRVPAAGAPQISVRGVLEPVRRSDLPIRLMLSW
jgi:hypothetical protein